MSAVDLRALPAQRGEQLASDVFENRVVHLLQSGRFSRRPWSWVARDENYFFKIPRIGNVASDDAVSLEARSLAKHELAYYSVLEPLSRAVKPPLAFLDKLACLAFEFIEGEDLRTLALRHSTPEQATQLLLDAVEIIANLHRRSVDSPPPEVLPKRYEVPPPRDRLVLVVKGIEVRNFRVDVRAGALRLLDPSRIEIGCPEDDFTRFVLSLLMLRWGRHADCRIWTAFDFPQLVERYESTAALTLDAGAMRYCFQCNLKTVMRDAKAEIGKMRTWLRLPAKVYMNVLFSQINHWTVKHGL